MKSSESDFLKQKYNLHNAPEVKTAAKRAEQETGEKVPQDPESQIQAYLDRLERLVMDPQKTQDREMFGGESRPRALLRLREMVMNAYVRPNKEKMAEGAARTEARAARTLGIQAEYGEEELAERGNIAVTDLEKSLDTWISYLSDMNEPYPTWFRYYTFRNILEMGDYDKDKGEFTKRSPGSVKLFPDIDRGALAYVEEMIEASKDPVMLERLQKAQRAAANDNIPEDQLITKEKAEQFAKLSFAKQYAEGIKQAGEITPEMREETRGEWKKYQQGTDPTALWASLQNKGTAWCTKGFGTAETQLKGGDFYIYYTYDKTGKPTIPRIAIRMQGENIGEVRGVADKDQNLEGNMIDIAEEKTKTLPGAEQYKKKSHDMKLLTEIENKTKKNELLTKDELVFLYELNTEIEGFGYQRDPRIKELRNLRNNIEKDIEIIFECTESQIAKSIGEITKDTKIYVGPLGPGIFTELQKYNIKHVYASFPENRITFTDIELGGKTKNELMNEMKQKDIKIPDFVEDMLNHKDFTVIKKKESATLIRLTVEALFSDNKNHTTDEIYEKAQELGLELCPSETGPQYRLQYLDQPMDDCVRIAMKQIADRVRDPNVFELNRDVDGLWLSSVWALPDDRWDPGHEFVFRSRKLPQKISS